jgi:hypothetical protein
LLGEIRGGEAFDLLQLLNTGHSGTLSTIHANSARQGLARFTSCVLQSGVDLPYRAIKTNIADSLGVVVHIERRPGRRYVSEILEIHGYDPDTDLFDYGAVFRSGTSMTTDSDFQPRSLTASEYVLNLFDPSENVAVLVRHRATGKAIQRIVRAETAAGPEFQTWLANQNALGSDVFLGMNPVTHDAASRFKANIKDIRTLYLDLDRNVDESLQTIRNSAEVPPPNFVLDTSPGNHQVVWKIRGVTQDQAESLLRGLASQFGRDPAATDSARVLRLPGFANRKRSGEFIVRAHHETDAVYALGDFAIEEESLQTPRQVSDAHQRRTVSHGPKSQSELDWAYAKRALARGDDSEQVVNRIADYRSEDKADPEHYARHTVMKAQARNEQERQATGRSKLLDSAPPGER